MGNFIPIVQCSKWNSLSKRENVRGPNVMCVGTGWLIPVLLFELWRGTPGAVLWAVLGNSISALDNIELSTQGRRAP